MAAQVMLGFLEGPTKAAVGSLLSAAGASTVLLLTPETALCFTYRQPYDDDIFKVGLIFLKLQPQSLYIKKSVADE